MTTPADWYPDPEDPTRLRYWDGAGWTEHRAPAGAPAGPAETPTPQAPTPQASDVPASEQATSVVSLPDQPTTSVPVETAPPSGGAHRAPDVGREPPAGAFTPTPSQPYDTHPTPSYQASSAPTPSSPTPSYETPSYQAPATGQPWNAAPAEPPGTPGPSAGPSAGPNMKLALGIIGGGLALLVAIILVTVFVLMRQDEPAVTSSPASSSSTKTTSSTTTSESSAEPSASETPTPPPTAEQGTDGDYTFSVAGTETGDTITSTVNESAETTANGMYFVVYVNVANTGTAPLTFVATFQQLSAAGQTFPLDDQGTAFLGGTVAQINPGDQVETPLVYDVPVGTEPDTIVLRADPSTPGVTLPLS